MKFVLISQDEQIVKAAMEAYGTHYDLKIHSDWRTAIEDHEGTNLMFVDIMATMKDPGKIEGYEIFAEAKLSHEGCKSVPLVAISLPIDYEVDSMVGWPGFIIALWHRPVDARKFRQASGYV